MSTGELYKMLLNKGQTKNKKTLNKKQLEEFTYNGKVSGVYKTKAGYLYAVI